MLKMKIGNIELKWTGHAGFLVKNKKIIYLDPYQVKSSEKADIILITHGHYDHCSIDDLKNIVKEGTSMVIPADCQSKINKLDNKVKIIILEPGNETSIENIKIKAVSSYNTNKRFHSKSDYWNGYILETEGIKIYHAGDTDLIPEMSELGKIDVALLPVSGTYVMTAEEAAKAAFLIKPKIAIPMHYGSVAGTKEDAENFVELCRQDNIKAEIMEKS